MYLIIMSIYKNPIANIIFRSEISICLKFKRRCHRFTSYVIFHYKSFSDHQFTYALHLTHALNEANGGHATCLKLYILATAQLGL